MQFDAGISAATTRIGKVLFVLTCLLPVVPKCFALDTKRSLDQFSYQTWQTGSGLPQNTIGSVLQSHDGFLWLASEGGLVRFDGFHFLVFDTRTSPALKSNSIRSLLEAEDDSLWIGTDAGLVRMKNSRFEPTPIKGNDASPGILSLHRDNSGNIWAVTPDGLAVWKPSSRRSPDFIPLPYGDSKLTGPIATDGRGTVWVGCQTGLRKLQAGQYTSIGEHSLTGAVTALLLDHSGRLWAGTSKGAFISSGGDFRPVGSPPGSPSIGAVLTAFEDWEGSIWLGTENGPVRVSHDAAQPYQLSRTLAGLTVISFAEDAEGDLWVGTAEAGVTVVRDQKFVTYTAREGLASDAVRCVFQGSDGAVSVGTNDGLTQIRKGAFKKLTTADGLSSNVILSLGADREGKLLVGTPDGLNRIGASGISVMTSAEGLADDFVRSVYRDSDGSLWLGTRHGLTHLPNFGPAATYTQMQGLGSDLVGAIVRARSGDLWVGTLDGLTRIAKDVVKTYRTQNGLSSNVITALLEDQSGSLWVGTQSNGLNVFLGGRFRRIARRTGVPDRIDGLAEDGNGELWIASNVGIVRVDSRELMASTQGKVASDVAVRYGTTDGLRIDECSAAGHPTVWKANDNTIWFSTVKGVAALYPDAARLNRVLPPVTIETVTVDDRNYAPSELHTLPPGHSRFAFEYAGLSFAAPQKVRYRYRLEGFDKDWIDAGTERVAYYTNVPPGSYRFHVLARNNDGFWNQEGAVMSFRLEPRFYQTSWFYALLTLALALVSYLIYRWRVSEVEARFGAVLQERNRIAREIHDTLAQGFVGVSVQLEIVSRLLASSTESAREHLDQARLQVRESLSEARRSIWQLRSQASDSEDLASRLSKAAAQSIGQGAVKFSLDVQGTYRPIAAGVEDELLRIGQEALTNAIRHAEAKHINIRLAFSAKRVRMTVVDDGRGFAVRPYASGPDGHFGLKGMRERAEQISAKFSVESAVGKGTKVSVEAPLS